MSITFPWINEKAEASRPEQSSSIQLSADQQKEIAEKLKIITGAKQIKLALKIDPQLIGGFTIEIGSKMIDTSIRGQLKQISSLLGS